MKKLLVVGIVIGLLLNAGICLAETDYKLGFIFGFDCGRSYQQGRSDGIDGFPMTSRSVRESSDLFSAWVSEPNLLELLHIEYERGYIAGVNIKSNNNKKIPYLPRKSPNEGIQF
jgi:hypothetical protein